MQIARLHFRRKDVLQLNGHRSPAGRQRRSSQGRQMSDYLPNRASYMLTCENHNQFCVATPLVSRCVTC
jgi:hypothetical protein